MLVYGYPSLSSNANSGLRFKRDCNFQKSHLQLAICQGARWGYITLKKQNDHSIVKSMIESSMSREKVQSSDSYSTSKPLPEPIVCVTLVVSFVSFSLMSLCSDFSWDTLLRLTPTMSGIELGF